MHSSAALSQLLHYFCCLSFARREDGDDVRGGPGDPSDMRLRGRAAAKTQPFPPF